MGDLRFEVTGMDLIVQDKTMACWYTAGLLDKMPATTMLCRTTL